MNKINVFVSKQYSFPDFPDKQDNQYRKCCVCYMVKPCTPARDLHALDYPVFHKGRVGLVDKHGVVLELVFVQHH